MDLLWVGTTAHTVNCRSSSEAAGSAIGETRRKPWCVFLAILERDRKVENEG
jgi:hypothetical protein